MCVCVHAHARVHVRACMHAPVLVCPALVAGWRLLAEVVQSTEQLVKNYLSIAEQ